MAARALLAVALACAAVAGLAAAAGVQDHRALVAALAADDPAVRTRAACELREEGDAAAGAIEPLVRLLADAAPVERTACERHWWRGSEFHTTPGEQAAAALVAIGSRAFEPLLAALEQPQWSARRNAAWALGALDDPRAADALRRALRDREPDVRAQAAWALGAIDVPQAVPELIAALKDPHPGVRRNAAWALGVIGR